MRVNRHVLEEALAQASPGPWTLDAFPDTDARGKYDAYCIRNGEDKAILDTMNSEAQRIFERDHRWDEQGRADLHLIVKMHTMLPSILDLLTWREIETLPKGQKVLAGSWSENRWQQEIITRRDEHTCFDASGDVIPLHHYSHWLALDIDPPPRP